MFVPAVCVLQFPRLNEFLFTFLFYLHGKPNFSLVSAPSQLGLNSTMVRMFMNSFLVQPSVWGFNPPKDPTSAFLEMMKSYWLHQTWRQFAAAREAHTGLFTCEGKTEINRWTEELGGFHTGLLCKQSWARPRSSKFTSQPTWPEERQPQCPGPHTAKR